MYHSQFSHHNFTTAVVPCSVFNAHSKSSVSIYILIYIMGLYKPSVSNTLKKIQKTLVITVITDFTWCDPFFRPLDLAFPHLFGLPLRENRSAPQPPSAHRCGRRGPPSSCAREAKRDPPQKWRWFVLWFIIYLYIMTIGYYMLLSSNDIICYYHPTILFIYIYMLLSSNDNDYWWLW